MEIYYTTESKRDLSILSYLPYSSNILLSAGRFYSSKLRKPKTIFKQPFIKSILIDSGAQQFSHFLEYPYSTKEYVEFSNHMEGDLVASLDYPLDMFEWRKIKIPHKILLEKTVLKASELFEYWEKDLLNGKPLLVIQGLELFQFLECLDLYNDYGLLNYKYFGIGSLCMSKYAKKKHIIQTTSEIRKKLKDKYLHVFGPDITSWKDLFNIVNSIDTSMHRPFRGRSCFGIITRSSFGNNLKDFKINGKIKNWNAIQFYTLLKLESYRTSIGSSLG